MNLKPRQIIGLVAIVVFGAIAVWRYTQPSESEIMAERLASLPSITAPTELPSFPPANIPSLTGPTAPTSVLGTDVGDGSGKKLWELSGIDWYNTGSQAAKDDLYCAGVLSAEFNAIKADAHPDKMSMLLRDGTALDEAGLAKLKAEKAVDNSGAGASLAWADKAEMDYAANALRISVADCTKRAAALATVEETGK